MIDKNTTLSLNWLSKVAKEYPKSDISLIEKTVRALVLLEGLQMQMDFIFASYLQDMELVNYYTCHLLFFIVRNLRVKILML